MHTLICLILTQLFLVAGEHGQDVVRRCSSMVEPAIKMSSRYTKTP